MRGPVLSPDFARPPQANVAAREPIPFVKPEAIKPEVAQQNLTIVRDGFFNKDGSSRMGNSVCGIALIELRQKCGDPAMWKDADMQKPEVQKLLTVQRALAMLRDKQPLIPSELDSIKSLLQRQQEIILSQNDEMKEKIKGGDDLAMKMVESGIVAQIEAQIVANQNEIKLVNGALQNGVPMESKPTAWGEPGKDMDVALAGSIVNLYDVSLSMTDAERAKDPSLNQIEPPRRQMNDAEKAAIMAKMKVFMELEAAAKQDPQQAVMDKLQDKMAA